MARLSGYEEVWSFATRNFRVALEVAPEDMDPRDSFESEEDIDLAYQGGSNWFRARVVVYGSEGVEFGADHLGDCSYSSFADFYQSHRNKNPVNRNCSVMRAAMGNNVVVGHYFTDMVREAIRATRAISSKINLREI